MCHSAHIIGAPPQFCSTAARCCTPVRPAVLSNPWATLHWVTCWTAQALRILQHACDSKIDSPDTPLALWDNLEKDVRGGAFGNMRVPLSTRCACLRVCVCV